MSTVNPPLGRILTLAGGALLLVSLFLPWAGAGGDELNGWELWTMSDVFLLIVGGLALAAGLTGGRFGFFRPDLSLNATADIFGVAATIVLAWLILFDFPEGAGREAGVYLALVASIAIACGAGDFRVTSLFPAIPGDRNRAA